MERLEVMAVASESVDVSKLLCEFDIDLLKNCNLISLSRHILGSFEDIFNFCCKIGLTAVLEIRTIVTVAGVL